jgi:hypothetical protein
MGGKGWCGNLSRRLRASWTNLFRSCCSGFSGRILLNRCIERSSTEARALLCDPGDMETTIHGLRGIFWALNMLVVHHVADDVAHKTDLRTGIDALIVAGQTLANEISNRF